VTLVKIPYFQTNPDQLLAVPSLSFFKSCLGQVIYTGPLQVIFLAGELGTKQLNIGGCYITGLVLGAASMLKCWQCTPLITSHDILWLAI
jgi:hypothetical protein